MILFKKVKTPCYFRNSMLPSEDNTDNQNQCHPEKEFYDVTLAPVITYTLLEKMAHLF